MNNFASVELPASLLKATTALGYSEMTPIQAQSLPAMLEGRDVRAQARTGSGKTAAFSLALLTRLRPDEPGLQALVLCPTRELADQVSREIRGLARFIPNLKVMSLCGGVPIRTQLASLSHPPSRAYYDRKRAQGKRHNQALIALARRRTDVLYAMLRDGTLYQDPTAPPAPSSVLALRPASTV